MQSAAELAPCGGDTDLQSQHSEGRIRSQPGTCHSWSRMWHHRPAVQNIFLKVCTPACPLQQQNCRLACGQGIFLFVCLLILKIGFPCVALPVVGLAGWTRPASCLEILLSPKCWNKRCIPPCLVCESDWFCCYITGLMLTPDTWNVCSLSLQRKIACFPT